MEIRHLRHVVALADQRNYARAAEVMGITQSALTRSIQTLENELGLRLFDRGREGAVPTTAGSELANHARSILAGMRTIERNMELLVNAKAGQVAFGCGPMIACLVLTDLLTHMACDYPNVRVEARVGGADQLVAALAADQMEFFILTRERIDANSIGASLHPVGEAHKAALVRSGHPLAGKPVTMAEMGRYPIISATLLPAEREIASYKPSISCDDYHVLRQVTLNSDAIWISVARDIGSGITALHYDFPRPQTQIVAVSLAGRTLSPAARLLIDLTTKLLAARRPARKRH